MSDLSNNRRFSLKAALNKGGAWLLFAILTSVGAQVPTAEGPPSPISTTLHNGASTQQIQSPPASKAWQQLTPAQKQALAPLGAQWGALTAQQQNKWLAISHNFSQLSVTEQITAHTRMADWVALSPQQRSLARLNFNKLQYLPREDKKAKWEAYQALPAAEKRLLSAGSATPTKSAAPTAKPLAPYRQVQTPERPVQGNTALPTAIDRKTLLPRPPALATPAPPAPTAPQGENPDSVRPSTETSPS